jgi:hypothetical protein
MTTSRRQEKKKGTRKKPKAEGRAYITKRMVEKNIN